MYTILYSPGARKDLQKLPVDLAKRIVAAIKEIKDNPKVHVKKLKGSPKSPLYSLRIGEYRVILSIDGDKLIVFVMEKSD
ncbi:mRNA-degrading endonuclease RelE of RelBE toxin-antitoxin system [Methanohalophilus euhalobius]|jgi:mRNA interferase RelE/StbE|uniref:mRNA interferase RelE/StbE n=1 Tax=Methanohalophilus euhalobius TaxID=51203 RepID=A0A285G0Y7_9EURY|nr:MULTISPECIES: type II toxin-antitoxin system RelE/ParE family toxin [Methanohalophilus]ODV49671.1 MAG: cytotoxic translational repressor of toxin-antitoxin stability system [Methanohalophilus sp. 2-GBenrich]RSD34960.1 MAG: cytotoxic translational repressor of toxin-antitoxin stability system [Methanohalophilus sp.]TCL11917.1 mRNA-degrading endonuclease RelE of RelBE toxin-antitoxin system [Methanohalophilus euhalobius]SNY17175.1 mRNA interferase RelE/StbE [Methanohalophilus euhalobius]